MQKNQANTSPYQEALAWIEGYPGTGSGTGLAKLILSLWNSDNAFSFRECIEPLGGDLTNLALRMATHFAEHGEDRELVAIGQKICESFPRLVELGQVAYIAKSELRGKWRDEEQARDDEEERIERNSPRR